MTAPNHNEAERRLLLLRHGIGWHAILVPPLSAQLPGCMEPRARTTTDSWHWNAVAQPFSCTILLCCVVACLIVNARFLTREREKKKEKTNKEKKKVCAISILLAFE